MGYNVNFKPRLLRETAEIALSEIKRFIEPKLIDEFSLRRVSAPLFLPVGSPLLDSRNPGVRITLPSISGEVEIVGSLDVWLRGQLSRYDIAPGFGVYTVMNAIRPSMPCNAVSSPHITAWAWQQVAKPDNADRQGLVSAAERIYSLLVDAEKMILDKFPHLSATLQKTLDTVDEADLERSFPEYTPERRVYEYLHPDSSDRSDRRSPEGHHCAALFLMRGTEGREGVEPHPQKAVAHRRYGYMGCRRCCKAFAGGQPFPGLYCFAAAAPGPHTGLMERFCINFKQTSQPLNNKQQCVSTS